MKRFDSFFVFIFFLSVLGFLSHPPSASAEVLNRVVAIVNSELITLYELNGRMKKMTGAEPADLRARDEKRYLETRRKILDALIDEKITAEKVRELGIRVTAKEVDSAIERIKKDNSFTQEDLIAYLKKHGTDYETYRKNIKDQIERIRLINFEVKSKIIIREEKIKEYYEQHKNKFRVEEKVRLATIVLRKKGSSDKAGAASLNEKAREISIRLRNGEDFGELAKKYSQGPGVEEGGDLGFFKTSQLNPELKEVIKDLAPGGISEPMVVPSGLQIIMLIKRQEGRLKTMEEVRDHIFQIFYGQEVNKRYSTWIKGLRKKAYTKIIF